MIRLGALALWFCIGAFLAIDQSAWAAGKKYVQIPVPVAMIYAGQPIDASQLRMRKVPARYLERSRVITDPMAIDGKLARSTLVPGRPIPINQIREPNVIEASKPVRIIFRTGSLEIIGEAIPLSSAAIGDRIRARNIDTGLIISGTAMSNGMLLVSGR